MKVFYFVCVVRMDGKKLVPFITEDLLASLKVRRQKVRTEILYIQPFQKHDDAVNRHQELTRMSTKRLLREIKDVNEDLRDIIPERVSPAGESVLSPIDVPRYFENIFRLSTLDDVDDPGAGSVPAWLPVKPTPRAGTDAKAIPLDDF